MFKKTLILIVALQIMTAASISNSATDVDPSYNFWFIFPFAQVCGGGWDEGNFIYAKYSSCQLLLGPSSNEEEADKWKKIMDGWDQKTLLDVANDMGTSADILLDNIAETKPKALDCKDPYYTRAYNVAIQDEWLNEDPSFDEVCKHRLFAPSVYASIIKHNLEMKEKYISYWNKACEVSTVEELTKAVQLASGISESGDYYSCNMNWDISSSIKEAETDDDIIIEAYTDGWWHSHVCTVGMKQGDVEYKIANGPLPSTCSTNGVDNKTQIIMVKVKDSESNGKCVVEDDGDFAWIYDSTLKDTNPLFDYEDVTFIKKIKIKNDLAIDKNYSASGHMAMNKPKHDSGEKSKPRKFEIIIEPSAEAQKITPSRGFTSKDGQAAISFYNYFGSITLSNLTFENFASEIISSPDPLTIENNTFSNITGTILKPRSYWTVKDNSFDGTGPFVELGTDSFSNLITGNTSTGTGSFIKLSGRGDKNQVLNNTYQGDQKYLEIALDNYESQKCLGLPFKDAQISDITEVDTNSDGLADRWCWGNDANWYYKSAIVENECTEWISYTDGHKECKKWDYSKNICKMWNKDGKELNDCPTCIEAPDNGDGTKVKLSAVKATKNGHMWCYKHTANNSLSAKFVMAEYDENVDDKTVDKNAEACAGGSSMCNKLIFSKNAGDAKIAAVELYQNGKSIGLFCRYDLSDWAKELAVQGVWWKEPCDGSLMEFPKITRGSKTIENAIVVWVPYMAGFDSYIIPDKTTSSKKLTAVFHKLAFWPINSPIGTVDFGIDKIDDTLWQKKVKPASEAQDTKEIEKAQKLLDDYKPIAAGMHCGDCKKDSTCLDACTTIWMCAYANNNSNWYLKETSFYKNSCMNDNALAEKTFITAKNGLWSEFCSLYKCKSSNATCMDECSDSNACNDLKKQFVTGSANKTAFDATNTYSAHCSKSEAEYLPPSSGGGELPEDCPKDYKLEGGICIVTKCPANKVPSPDGTKCIEDCSKIKGSISVNEQCVCNTANHWTQDGTGCKCDYDNGYTLKNGACTIDDNPPECSEDSDCDDDELCDDGECVDIDGPKKGFGESCKESSECNSSKGLACADGTCYCDTDNNWTINTVTGNSCIKGKPKDDDEKICKINGGTYIKKGTYCEFNATIAACKTSGRTWNEADKLCSTGGGESGTAGGCASVSGASLPENIGTVLPYLLVLGIVLLFPRRACRQAEKRLPAGSVAGESRA